MYMFMRAAQFPGLFNRFFPMAYSDLFSVDVVLALLAFFKTLVPHAAPLWQQKYIQCFCDCKGMNISSTCPLFAPARVIVLPTEIHCLP